MSVMLASNFQGPQTAGSCMSPHSETIVGWHKFESGGENLVDVCVWGAVSNEGSISSLTAYHVNSDFCQNYVVTVE